VSAADPHRRPAEGRISLGTRELDEMLDGGLMPHRPYLLVGPAGTGKTTLALQFLCEGVRRGEKSLYVTLEDPPNEVRWNHRGLRPELDSVDVFDAIPDVMRYERVPFKDIAAVRQVVPFASVPDGIRQTPEFSSVEITGTALEQMLRSEIQKRGYQRLVIDSLTALQYFCMKGFDPTVGAQTFLRFLTDLRMTTVLTVEASLEDVETPERMLARGEVRLFRWELDGVTVRAVGVEKFRGSSHDVRLHPYRIGSKGLDVQLARTISRDTRRLVEPALAVALAGEGPALPSPVPPAAVRPSPPPAPAAPEPLSQQIRDLLTLHVDLSPLRSEVEAALTAVEALHRDEASARLSRITAMMISLAPLELPRQAAGASAEAVEAAHRVSARADRIREGEPPTQLPSPGVLAKELRSVLALVPAPSAQPAPPLVPPPPPAAPPSVPAPAPAIELPSVHKRPVVVVPIPEPLSAAPAEPTPPSAVRPSRKPPVPAVGEHPPLPVVARLPGPEAPAPAGAAGPSVPASALPEAASATAPVRRRRRTPTAKAVAEPVPTEGGPVEATPAVRPKRRTVRRKKAPPVVAAAAVAPPEVAAPPPAPVPPSEPVAPAQEPT